MEPQTIDNISWRKLLTTRQYEELSKCLEDYHFAKKRIEHRLESDLHKYYKIAMKNKELQENG